MLGTLDVFTKMLLGIEMQVLLIFQVTLSKWLNFVFYMIKLPHSILSENMII